MKSITEMFVNKEVPKVEQKKRNKTKWIQERLQWINVKYPSIARRECNQYLLDKKMTDQQFGERLGIDRRVVGKWMSGKSKPSEDMIKKIEKIYGIHSNKWSDKFEENKSNILARRELEKYLKDNKITHYEFSLNFVGYDGRQIYKWLKDSIPSKDAKETIFNITKIPVDHWHLWFTDKEWDERLAFHKLPWVKNEKTILRKKEKEKLIEEYNDIIQKENYDESKVIIHHSTFTSIQIVDDVLNESCEKCSARKHFKSKYCRDIMFSITGIDCKSKNVYFDFENNFRKCSREFVRKYDELIEISTNKKFKVVHIFNEEEFVGEFVGQEIGNEQYKYVLKFSDFKKEVK